MAIVVHPIDASAGAPAYTAQQTRQAFGALTGFATTARPLGARSGVRPGTPATTVALSGAGSTTWTVGAHSGILDTESPVAAGAYQYATDGTDTGTITAASVSIARVDIIWVAVNDTVQDSSGLRNGVVTYQAGTVAGTAPAPTNARAMVLAQINVPISGGGAPTVTWVAPYSVAAGGILVCKSSADYPTSAQQYEGLYVEDQTLNYLLRSNGTTLSKYEAPRVGASCTSAGDTWATDGAVVSLGNTGGAWTSREDSNGFVTAGATTTPITIPAGQDGEYLITIQGLDTTAATGLSRAWIQLGGTLPVTGTPTSFRTSISTGETNWSVTAKVRLAAGNTIGTQMALTTGGTKSASSWLSITRIGP
jgi:hypothetical protein